MERPSEKNGQHLITPNSSVVVEKSKIRPGLAIGVSSVLLFISVVTMVTTYDYAVGMLGVKRIFERIHKREMDMQKGVPNVQDLFFVNDSPPDCPCRTLNPYPIDFKRHCRHLIPVYRFLRKLRPTQNNTLQATQG